jgi:hypothetical protein
LQLLGSLDGDAYETRYLFTKDGIFSIYAPGAADPAVSALAFDGSLSTLTVGDSSLAALDMMGNALRWSPAGSLAARFYVPGAGQGALIFDGDYCTGGASFGLGAPTTGADGRPLYISAGGGGTGVRAGGGLHMLAGAPSGGGTAGIGYLDDHSANPKLRWGATVGLEVPSGVAMTFAGEIGLQRQTVDYITSSSGRVNIPIGALSIGAAPADDGVIRIPNAGVLKARNNGGGGNLMMMATSAADSLFVGDTSNSGLYLNTSGGVVFQTEGTSRVIVFDDQMEFQSGIHLDFTEVDIRRQGGTLIASSGAGTLGLRAVTPVAAPDYTVTNPSTDRTFDAAAADLAETRNVVGTMIADLIAVGIYQ